MQPAVNLNAALLHAVESSYDMIGLLSQDGTILYESPSITRVLGFLPQDLIGSNAFDLVHPDDLPKLREEFAVALNRGRGEVSAYRCRSASGEWRWIESTGSIVSQPSDANPDPVSQDVQPVPDPNIIIVINSRDVTERKKANEALRRSEERFRAFLDNTPACVFIKDEDGHYVYLNKAVEKLVHTPASELLGKTAFDRLPRSLAQPLRENCLSVLASGKAQEFEEVVPGHDGTLRHEIVVKFPFTDIDERRLIAGVAIDITERKQAEAALQKERDFIATVLDTVGCLVVVLDRAGRVVTFNRVCEELSGYSFEEVQGKDILPLVLSPEGAVSAAALIRDMHAGNFPNTYENYWITRDGRQRHITWSNTALLDASGKVEYVIATGTDITERTQIESKLHASQERLQVALEGGQIGLWELDVADDKVVAVRFSKQWKRQLGYEDDEIVDAPYEWEARLHPDDQVTAHHQLDQLIISDSSLYQNEFRLLHKDGAYRWILSQGTIFRTADGKAYRVLGSHVDITEIKQAEAELRRSQDELRHAHDVLEQRVQERTAELGASNQALKTEIAERQMAMGVLREVVGQLERAREDADVARLEAEQSREEAERANHSKSEFLSRMSHELRTPMNSILGFAQLMEMHARDEKEAERVGYIMKAGQHLLKLINEVLDLARIESGRLGLSPEPIHLDSIIRMALDMIRPLCQQREVQLTYEATDCENFFVRADQQRLLQILLNLLSNATKYNRQGGDLWVKCEGHENKKMRLSIRDTGAGLNSEQISNMFQPFERLGAESSNVEGTGLGLALSKRLIEAMGGTIGVESTLGEGSTFWLDLEITEKPLDHLSEEELATTAIGSLEKAYTILYIEDNLANLQVIEHILQEQANVNLLTATQGQVGLELARQHQPSLILLDLHLPDINGDEVLRRLLADPATCDVPVVIVSADATHNQIRRLLLAGASDYLTKPIDVRRFLEVVHELLRRSEK